MPPPGRGSLPPEQVQSLEDRLKANAQDSDARRQLIEHYSRNQFRSPEARQARQRHILWVIEHDPLIELRGPDLALNARLDEAAYEAGKQLWQKQVDAHPKDVAFLDRAADYALLTDRDTAESLWKRAEALQPHNPRWPERLSHLYSLAATSPAGTNLELGRNALAAMERALSLGNEGDFNRLISLPKLAIAAGETDKARDYAREVLKLAPANEGQWNYGNALHEANIALGKIALQEGRMAEAKSFLLAAGNTPGSPQLNSFGPHMSLAHALLEKGEKETVLAYFDLCRVFWRMGGTNLDAWTEAVKQDSMPDFGPRLRY